MKAHKLAAIIGIQLRNGYQRPHGSRFRNALVIVNLRVSSPSGLALLIADACREMHEHESVGTDHVRNDPAIRLMVYQLARLFGVVGVEYAVVGYMSDEAACKQRLAELGLRPFGAS